MPPKELIQAVLAIPDCGPVTVNALVQSSCANLAPELSTGDTLRFRQALYRVLMNDPAIVSSLMDVPMAAIGILGFQPPLDNTSRQAVLTEFSRNLNTVPTLDRLGLTEEIGNALRLEPNPTYLELLHLRLEEDAALGRGTVKGRKRSVLEFVGSNEPSLPYFYDFVSRRKGSIAGVGVEQMLDMYAYSDPSEVFVIDRAELTSHTTRLLLEAGAFHKSHFRRYPTPEELIGYFTPENIMLLGEMIFRETGMEIDAQAITEWGRSDTMGQELSYDRYLKFRSKFIDEHTGKPVSWLHSYATVRRVIQGYIRGRIHVLNTSIEDEQLWGNIDEHLRRRGDKLMGLYMSNVEEYFLPEEVEQFFNTIGKVTKTDDMVMMRTFSEYVQTLPLPVFDGNGDYYLFNWHYNVQEFDHYRRHYLDYMVEASQTGQGVSYLRS